MKALSVISSFNQDDSSPVSRITASISSARSSCASCRLETLTHMMTGAFGPNRACQSTILRHDSTRMIRPSCRIKPVSSATGMNSTGLISPRSGCRQRASASKPLIRPVASATIGW
jgi:hypothetical protein